MFTVLVDSHHSAKQIYTQSQQLVTEQRGTFQQLKELAETKKGLKTE